MWPSIVENCEVIIHTASPNPFAEPADELELIYPAVEGACAICYAAILKGVKKIIVTGSIGNIRGTKHKSTFTEETWAEDLDNLLAYEKSKLLQEKTFFHLQSEHPNS